MGSAEWGIIIESDLGGIVPTGKREEIVALKSQI